MKTLDHDGISTLLRAAEGNDMRPTIALMLLTGLRRGEALGLKWNDFDSVGGRLTIRRALESHNGAFRVKAPKPLARSAPLSWHPKLRRSCARIDASSLSFVCPLAVDLSALTSGYSRWLTASPWILELFQSVLHAWFQRPGSEFACTICVTRTAP